MSTFLKSIYRFNTISVVILEGIFFFFLVEISKLILKCTWKSKGPRTAKMTSKKHKGFTLPDFKPRTNVDM